MGNKFSTHIKELKMLSNNERLLLYGKVGEPCTRLITVEEGDIITSKPSHAPLWQLTSYSRLNGGCSIIRVCMGCGAKQVLGDNGWPEIRKDYE